MSDVFKVPAPVGDKRWVRRSSPLASTSSAPDRPPAPPSAAAAAGGSAKDLPNSVYCHLDDNIKLNDIGQLRGLKSGRRRGRWRRLHQAKLAMQYSETIKFLEPVLSKEIVEQQSQQVLIASALDHFANTVNLIVDNVEGTDDPTNFTARLEAFKKKATEFREKRRARNPDAPEFQMPPTPAAPVLSDEETSRSLREETEAAVEALLTGDKDKEVLPDHFADIITAFQMA